MVFSGELKCQRDICNNRAYYQVDHKYLCGVHSRKFSDKRIELPVDPNKEANKQIKIDLHMEKCNLIAEKNKLHGKIGDVICRKMYMMKLPELIEGYINVFPNFKHGNRKDGLGMPSLSPKSIGPIDHKQPNLPIALNLENFHQGNKVFTSEINENGEPTYEFYKTQKQMYSDPIPHRHKLTANGNVPVYSIWIDKKGTTHKIDYFTSRQFYCSYYERFTRDNPDFLTLKHMIANGFNLCICGYDGYPITMTLEEHYLDTSKPFGHELVLYTMLTTDHYPWIKYKTFEF
jgi:hypothetical protein